MNRNTRWYDRLHILGIGACIAAIVLGAICYIAIERPLVNALDAEALQIRADGDSRGLLPGRHYVPAGVAWLTRQVVTAGIWIIGVILAGIGTIGFWRSSGTRKKLRDTAWITVISTMVAGLGMTLL
jgi:hypothetical protein